nr:MAG TPA: hypothetical protein [Caudoviricetes sp.]
MSSFKRLENSAVELLSFCLLSTGNTPSMLYYCGRHLICVYKNDTIKPTRTKTTCRPRSVYIKESRKAR